MKKFISLIALAAILFACTKTEDDLPAGGNTETPGEEKATLSVVTTYWSPDITYTSATAGGNVTVSGTGSIRIVDRGVCYSTSPAPTIAGPKVSSGSGTGTFTVSLTGLDSATTYYIRAYATKKNGVTKYGNELTFTTLTPPTFGTMTDIDGNVYATITIGTQTWMLENLRTTRYRNGDLIKHVTDNTEWANLRLATDKGGWCYYNNDPSNDETYGKLYNFYAATDTRNIAPEGWRMPAKGDWDILALYLGADNIQYPTNIQYIGRKLKETGIDHWLPPNPADNVGGFTALPGGYRNDSGVFSRMNSHGYFWSSSSENGNPFFRELKFDVENVRWGQYFGPAGYRPFGFSVRCVMD